mmetsp:Transcript_23548/g.58172  ORF Transcript_23548/g.58172 Transcript_23548/m.58172 type:complete len:213 (+) Transcript_23548:1039-1677(+)
MQEVYSAGLGERDPTVAAVAGERVAVVHQRRGWGGGHRQEGRQNHMSSERGVSRGRCWLMCGLTKRPVSSWWQALSDNEPWWVGFADRCGKRRHACVSLEVFSSCGVLPTMWVNTVPLSLTAIMCLSVTTGVNTSCLSVSLSTACRHTEKCKTPLKPRSKPSTHRLAVAIADMRHSEHHTRKPSYAHALICLRTFLLLKPSIHPAMWICIPH